MSFITFAGVMFVVPGLLIVLKPAVWLVASDIWLSWQGLQRSRPESNTAARLAGFAFICIGAAIIYGDATALAPAQLFDIYKG